MRFNENATIDNSLTAKICEDADTVIQGNEIPFHLRNVVGRTEITLFDLQYESFSDHEINEVSADIRVLKRNGDGHLLLVFDLFLTEYFCECTLVVFLLQSWPQCVVHSKNGTNDPVAEFRFHEIRTSYRLSIP